MYTCSNLKLVICIWYIYIYLYICKWYIYICIYIYRYILTFVDTFSVPQLAMSSFPSDIHFNVDFTMDSQCWLRGGPANRGICRTVEALGFAVNASMKDLLWTLNSILDFLDLKLLGDGLHSRSQRKAGSTGGRPSFWRTSIFGEGLNRSNTERCPSESLQ